jgi:hypothetical protein
LVQYDRAARHGDRITASISRADEKVNDFSARS